MRKTGGPATVLRRRSWGIAVVTVAGLVPAALLTGCGPASTPDPAALPVPAVTAVPSPASAVGLVLPLAAYQLSADQQRFVNRADLALVIQCMRRVGFSQFSLGDGPADTKPIDAMSRRYALVTDPATAAAYGYHLPADVSPGRSSSPTPSESERIALTGNPDGSPGLSARSGVTVNGQAVPVGGCYGEASRAMAFNATVDTALPDRLGFTSYDRSRGDERVRTATAAWSACMKEHGYAAADPVGATTGLSMAGVAAPAEIQQAVTDVGCQRASNLVGVWFAVESAYQRQLIDVNAEALNAVRHELDENVRNATRVLGAGAPA